MCKLAYLAMPFNTCNLPWPSGPQCSGLRHYGPWCGEGRPWRRGGHDQGVWGM